MGRYHFTGEYECKWVIFYDSICETEVGTKNWPLSDRKVGFKHSSAKLCVASGAASLKSTLFLHLENETWMPTR